MKRANARHADGAVSQLSRISVQLIALRTYPRMLPVSYATAWPTILGGHMSAILHTSRVGAAASRRPIRWSPLISQPTRKRSA